VASLADPKNPLLSELTSGTTQDLSCYITAEGFQTTLDEQEITDQRLCSRAVYERPGRWRKSMTLTYVYNMADPENNVAYLTLAYLTMGFIVARWGIPFETPWAEDDIVDVYPIQAGKPVKNQPTANGVLTVTQRLFIIGESIDDAVVAAG